MKNWVVAAVAIGLGIAVSAALLIYTDRSRSEVQVYALARDVAGGEPITPDALRLDAVVVHGGATSLLKLGDEAQLRDARAAHDLVAGDLLQRSDVAVAGSVPDERLVLIPVKDAPPAVAGDRVDLLVVRGTAESPSVQPFALGVEVRAVTGGGLVVAVPSKQATAFVYAAEAMHLVAVIAAPDAHAGSEEPVSSSDQAQAAVAQP